LTIEYDAVLEAYVDDEGCVDYAGLKAPGALEPYLAVLARADPEPFSTTEQLAFWINAYNAYTLGLIADRYPVRSIKRITPTGIPITIPFVHSPFRIRFAVVGGRTLSLDDIEHRILRRRFTEPRIHFALVCAARSCPRLRREAYTGDGLDRQLDDQARVFLHDRTKNRIPDEGGVIRLSRIFSWFGRDFGPDAAHLQAFLAPYFAGEVRKKL
jgi:hypothetical protein